MGLAPTLAALFGSIATAIAIFGGGLAVEAYKRHQDRMGMALAVQAMLIRQMSPLWQETQKLGLGLVVDLRKAAGGRQRVRHRT